ncbi:MAG TPA: helix-hairpin-helix domain-containing protein [Pyrinomonadaceae bacterium]|nr:helix-hairpin-helix domain-containing protein [Pyrinomonadaceae bacterium]
MTQRRHVGRAHSFFTLFLACLLAGASPACVKLPRRILFQESVAQFDNSKAEPAAPLININTASHAELEKLPGIGRALAARIVAFRAEYGRFRRAEHLMMVRGISERRFRAMSQFITAE